MLVKSVYVAHTKSAYIINHMKLIFGSNWDIFVIDIHVLLVIASIRKNISILINHMVLKDTLKKTIVPYT